MEKSSESIAPSRLREWARLIKDTGQAWNEDKALRLSAALSYYSVFSIAPLLVITIAIAGLFLDDEAATGQLYAAMKGYVGSQAASAIEAMVESASTPKSGIVATCIGAATLLLGASGVLGQLKDALNTIWEVEVKEGVGWTFFLRSKFLNFGMVLVIGLLLLISLVLSSWLATLNQSLHEFLELPALAWTIITSVVSAAASTTLFAMLFKFLPDAKIRWSDVWVGALLTALLFEIGKTALGWYLGRESTANAYGSAGSVVLLILWVYYASCILLFGAEFTQTYAKAKGRSIQPRVYARQMGSGDRAAEGLSPKSEPAPITSASEAPPETEDAFPPPPRRGPVFSHHLAGPLLKYLEGRGLLLSIEAKEALSQAAGILIGAAIACATLFVAWTLFAIALVGVLTSYFEWYWVKAVAAAGAVHLLVAISAVLIIWRRAVAGPWFTETFNELRKDRLWLRGTTH